MSNTNSGYCIIHETPFKSEDSTIIAERPRRVDAQGTLQDVEYENRNKRIYTAKSLFPQLTCERTLELLKNGYLLGEAGHPIEKDVNRQQTIFPRYCAVRYNKLWHDGDRIKATFQGTNNDLGETFNQDLLDGYHPAFSLRALGCLVTRNGKAYVENTTLVTWDFVIYPSHKVAYTEKIVTESASIAEQYTKRQNLLESFQRDTGNQLFVNEDYSGTIMNVTNSRVINAIAQNESATVKTLMDNFNIDYKDINVKLGKNKSSVELIDEGGAIMVVPLEEQVHREIMDFVGRL